MGPLGICAEGVGTVQFAVKGVKDDQRAYLDVLKKTRRPDIEMLSKKEYFFTQAARPPTGPRPSLRGLKRTIYPSSTGQPPRQTSTPSIILCGAYWRKRSGR